MKIIVLDFQTTDVIITDIPNTLYQEEFIERKLGLNTNACQWMIADELTIKIKGD